MARVSLVVFLIVAAVTHAAAQPAPPSPRALSGTWRTDEASAAGTAVVRLTYDDLGDARPPAGVEVALVSYASDGTVRVKRARTDAGGKATFPGLESGGSVAYFALAALPRNRRADRLVSGSLVPEPGAGARVLLSAEKRGETKPALDERLPPVDAPPPAPPKGKVHIVLEGASSKGSTAELVDAATGKVVARGVVPDKELVLATAARTGAVLYAVVTSGTRTYRSAPFLVVGDRGAHVSVWIFPVVWAQLRLMVEAEDVRMTVTGDIGLANNTWTPYAQDLPLRVPLPRGATRVHVWAEGADDEVPVDGGAFLVERALPPGGRIFRVRFELPAAGAQIPFELDLPFGSFSSTVSVDRSDGVTLEGTGEYKLTDTVYRGAPVTAMNNVTILPGGTLSFAVNPPRWSRLESTLAAACRPLHPDRGTRLRGKSAPALTLARAIDGKRFELSALRGKPVLITFMASWDMLSAEELPTIAALKRALPGLEVVAVASDAEAAKALDKVGRGTAFHVVLDPPVGDENIGPTTRAWGVPLLPESFLLDRKHVVRFYFPNKRDWGSAEARACAKAVAGVR